MKDHITSIYQVWFDFYKILTCLCSALGNVTADVVCTKKHKKPPTNYVTNKRAPIYQIISCRSQSTIIQYSANITEHTCMYRKRCQGVIFIIYICIARDGEVQTSNQFLLASLISIPKKKKKKKEAQISFGHFLSKSISACLVKNSASFGRALLGGIRASLKASLAC